MRIPALIFLLLSFISVQLNAQHKFHAPDHSHEVDLKKAASKFNSDKLYNTEKETVETHLLNNLSNLRPQKTKVQLLHHVASRRADHYLFRQTFDDIPVYRAEIKVNVSKNGKVLSLIDNSYALPSTFDITFPGEEQAEALVDEWYPNQKQIHRLEIAPYYFMQDAEFVPVLRIEIADQSGNYFERLINTNGKVIYERDLNNYHHAPALAVDSPATAKVFNPDPLTTAEVEYGAPYEDASDNDNLQLNMERQDVNIDVLFENDSFHLESPYCKITEFSFPEKWPVKSDVPVFHFTRSQDGFEDVNAFYHINYYQQYLRQLGYTNLVDYPIWVDVHALSNADNSNFSAGYNPPRLSFGEGGVDDAEDADVIIHEYGHAISHSAAPGTNSGSERTALDEANGDYFAASYSRSISEFNWERVFSWDGHNIFWPGRFVVSAKHYPEDLAGNLYIDAEIWSATLMEIWGDIGREVTDNILLQSMYSYSTNMSMMDAAYLFLQADNELYGGFHFTPISERMVARGLLPDDVSVSEVSALDEIRLLNTQAFATGSGSALLILPENEKATVSLYDVQGKLIWKNEQAESQVSITNYGLPQGLYILNVVAEKHGKSFRLAVLR